MKKLLLIFTIILSWSSSNSEAKDWTKLNIFACTPEWGSLAMEIVGNKANVFVAATPFQDPHYVEIQTRMTSEIIKSDVVFCTGANLESSWLPTLLESAHKEQIQEGGIASFMAADYIEKLEIPREKLDKNQVNNHPFGNPHIHLNPHNISIIAERFTQLVKKLDSDNADFYQARYSNFISRWNEAIIKWEKNAASLKNMPIMVRHSQWSYLANWLGLNIVATLEERPGVPPSVKYINQVLKNVNVNPAEMIIYSPFESNKIVLWMRSKARTKDVKLPYTVGAHPKIKNLFDLFDYTINILQLERQRKEDSVLGNRI
jgi:zinc/manganese transport system substrate-binding protein